jgi:hypothetical protein
MTLRRLCLFAAVLLALPAGPVRAQEVRISGDDRSPAAQLAREILARNNYVRIDRDTTLPADFRAPGDLVIYDAEVRLEGQVEGSVAVFNGQLFIRPRSRIGGDIAVIGGDVYTSALATTGRIIYPDPRTQVALAEDSAGGTPGEVRLTPPRPKRFVTFLPSPYPSYDRVNGLTASLGARFLLARTDSGPRVDTWVSYRQENPDRLGGGARVDLPLGTQNLRVVGEASRQTRTNDAWIRNDLSNSLAFAVRGSDYRDYYDADRASLLLTRPLGKPLTAGESWLSPRVGVQWERARSLETRDDLWTLFDDDDEDRVNPPVLEGEIVSALVGADLRWQGRISGFTGGAHLEYAIPGASDAEFAQVLVDGRYTTTAFRTHIVDVHFRGMMPVGGDDAPPQRFGILGGSGTLPTLEVADFRGDHLAFIEAVYAVPIRWIELPYLGVPNIEVLYATGAAWTDDMPEWVQNPGVGLDFTLARVRFYIDPATDETQLSFNFSIPRF